MAHNARIRADLAAWTAHVPVDPAEFEALDQAQFESINGDDGGAWNPAAFVSIGGSGVEFRSTGHTIPAGGTITATGGGAFIVASTGSIDLVGNGGSQTTNMTVSAGAGINIQGAAGAHGRLQIAANADATWYASATATFSAGSGLNINGVALVGSTGYVNVDSGGVVNLLNGSDLAAASGSTSTYDSGAVLNVNTQLTIGSGGYIKHAVYSTSADADAALDLADGDHFRHNGGLTATRRWTIPKAGVVNGHRIMCTNLDTSDSLEISDGVVRATLRNATGIRRSVQLEFNALDNEWQVVSDYVVP